MPNINNNNEIEPIHGDFIKLYRKFLEWGWYQDANTKSVFLHLLLKASWKEREFKGVKLDRGQYVTSIRTLSESLGMSVQSVRTSLKKLEETREVTKHLERGMSIFTILSYNQYQSNNKGSTNDQQTTNKGLTNDQHNIEEEGKKERKKEKSIPTFFEFYKYALSKNPKVDKDKLKMKYDSWIESGWCVQRNGKLEPIKIWKSTLTNTMIYGHLNSDEKQGQRI